MPLLRRCLTGGWQLKPERRARILDRVATIAEMSATDEGCLEAFRTLVAAERNDVAMMQVLAQANLAKALLDPPQGQGTIATQAEVAQAVHQLLEAPPDEPSTEERTEVGTDGEYEVA